MTDFAALHELATKALANAHAPYSRLQVGSAVLSATGMTYCGCNVENVAFPIGGCAEHHAVAAAVLAEGPRVQLVAVAVEARNLQGLAVAIPPCGACRQMIMELGPQAQVSFLARSGYIERHAISDLLPQSFTFELPD